MKKVFMGLSLLIGLMFFSVNVYAASFKVNIVGNNTFEDEITLNVQVDSLVDFDGACDGLCGLVGTLEYDTNKIEIVSIKALENFDLTQGNRLVLYRTTGVKSGTQILSITLKNKSLKENESVDVTLSNLVASDGDQDITASDAKKTIQFVSKKDENTSNEPTDNPNDSNNQTQNNSSNENQSNNNQKPNNQTTNNSNKSSNNNLASITLSNGDINFLENILVYDVVVENNIDTITIDAQLADSKASLEGNGIHELKVGNNEIVLTVTAEDGSKKEYTINVYREAIENDEENTTSTTNPSQDSSQEENNSILPVLIVIISCFIVFAVVIFYIYQKKKKNSTKE